MDKGESEASLIHQAIEYCICKATAEQRKGAQPALAERAYDPREIQNSYNGKGKEPLELDTEWYKTTQLMPPITRLIEHFDGLTVEFAAQCLGLDGSKYVWQREREENDPQQ